MSRSDNTIQQGHSRTGEGVVYPGSGYNYATTSDTNLEHDSTPSKRIMAAGALVSAVPNTGIDNVPEVDSPRESTSLHDANIPAARTRSSSQLAAPSINAEHPEITPRGTSESVSSSRTMGRFTEEFDADPASSEESLEASWNVIPDPPSTPSTRHDLNTQESALDEIGARSLPADSTNR
ncbi:hypothetical protein I302_100333 [Kwoniella bestiolae CBS 10118]|uniref:Uncharacterized protein n=1 Tax=Kwoniella bestiolae CBS 10118 TaxID=1296100 RepID=A0A1B9G4V3_9TREE|nr:hypothetical protein I302_03705 [Kwoniella bestiolae CBS 10118]OCF26028.1 hypothetical protein I302_03705 [Kwoniella bestiolae CBS 10118]